MGTPFCYTRGMTLSRLLRSGEFPRIRREREKDAERQLELLQRRALRAQQGIWHQRRRAVVVLEGFDAAGKGGVIRRLTKLMDPRGFRVHPIGPPTQEERGQHYLQRFWARLPAPGTIAVFDRSWYGRVLVERVEKLAPPRRLKEAYSEINEFERMLRDDGIDVIKIFLAIDADEQRRRFKDRMRDPYKRWKLTKEDLQARARWDDYVDAVDEMLDRTSPRPARWHLIPANDKQFARVEALRAITGALREHWKWMERQAGRKGGAAASP